jgi:hypothetical protein
MLRWHAGVTNKVSSDPGAPSCRCVIAAQAAEIYSESTSVRWLVPRSRLLEWLSALRPHTVFFEGVEARIR